MRQSSVDLDFQHANDQDNPEENIRAAGMDLGRDLFLSVAVRDFEFGLHVRRYVMIVLVSLVEANFLGV